MAKKADRKTCFVVGPIGADDSDDRIHADWLLEEIIQPVFTEHFKDFDVTRADKIADPGRIDAQVISHLLDSELVIADLTTLNPNAFYEIGIRHTVQKPIIHMHLEGQRIPFDIASFRSIKFERKRPRDLKLARDALVMAVRAAVDPQHEVDNPITVARGRIEFEKSATPTERVVQESMDAINEKIHVLEGLVRDQMDHSSTRFPNAFSFAVRRRPRSGQDVVRIISTGVTSARQLAKIIIDILPSHFGNVDIIYENEFEVVFAVEKSNNNQIKVNTLATDVARYYPDVRVEIIESN